MRPVCLFAALFLSLLTSLAADFSLMKLQEVRPVMEEILQFHVETKNLTPQVMQRAVKNFVTQFDGGKVYLLQQEIGPLFDLNPKEIREGLLQFEKGEWGIFLKLNEVIQNSIKRVRHYRQEVIRELILSSEESTESLSESYLRFSANKRELRCRIKKELLWFLARERQKKSSPWTLQRKEKVLQFFARQAERREKAYLEGGERGEHALCVHVLKSLARSLDAHTAFYTPQEAFEMRLSLEKEFEGIGVVLKEDVDGVLIAGLLEGSPAKSCGRIFPGDYLLQINKESASLLSYDEVLDRMKEGRRVALKVQHLDGSSDEVALERARIELFEERAQISSIPFGAGVIGKIDLPSFYEGSQDSSSEKDLMAALKELKKRGELLGLVLDLRENSGGFLTQAVKVAGLFISSGVVVVSKYSKGEVQYLRDVDGKVYYDGPLVILTSRASASAAEIVAAALQDWGTALVVGDKRTYGKGTIQYQTLTDKEAKIFFKVTVGRYYTASGRSTQIEGVKGDIHVPTIYSAHQMGERYLDYPLSSDRISPSFIDPLADVNERNKLWFQRYYLPALQKKTSYWKEMIPQLAKNSDYRLARNRDFQLFLRALKQEAIQGNWGSEDLQMDEAVQIIRDMILLHKKKFARTAFRS
ncbi:MAG: hypothetical protein A2Y28_02195 [Chlamydiae bacterium GWC2_50_10]|nr:MAG: hypothetical protein A2Z85_00850 [Chlamydiae bacterium GWA2_50_15]OGN53948.1 MAG: hypothetical protein A2Y28_02195 [Chlamydiae bacterium GWC2_50_10]OGN58030.1 MAG: hypothetical protein A3D18_00575 [Chlamydiae bacterium RIFCSPHIGHO2_02_FULL_49_29]OGN63684.1 MAG: hypothetical protein A3E26_01485 [Chlamydiae bacterium RIFCSPHIGHO2_12_FULL_49_32]OGN73607.1 MAG: hypothetical protein A3G30_00700 [Chlamydiae bacterium RIFCSPLOWO2_12_FULL_49_12]